MGWFYHPPRTPAQFRQARRLVRKIQLGLLSLALLWAAMVGLLASRQRAVLYPQWPMDVSGELAHATVLGMVPLSLDRAMGPSTKPALDAEPPMGVRAWVSTDALVAQPARGTVVVFHGNADRALNRAVYATVLGRLGYRVVLAEYPGYASFPGVPSEESLAANDDALLDTVQARFDGPIVLVGESLGAGAAARVAQDRGDLIQGVVLITPWDNLLAVAQQHYPWAPVAAFLHERYDSVRALRRFHGFVSVVAAHDDVVIPESHAQTLAQALPRDRTRFIEVPGGHTTWQLPDGFWSDTLAWMGGHR